MNGYTKSETNNVKMVHFYPDNPTEGSKAFRFLHYADDEEFPRWEMYTSDLDSSWELKNWGNGHLDYDREMEEANK